MSADDVTESRTVDMNNIPEDMIYKGDDVVKGEFASKEIGGFTMNVKNIDDVPEEIRESVEAIAEADQMLMGWLQGCREKKIHPMNVLEVMHRIYTPFRASMKDQFPEKYKAWLAATPEIDALIEALSESEGE